MQVSRRRAGSAGEPTVPLRCVDAVHHYITFDVVQRAVEPAERRGPGLGPTQVMGAARARDEPWTRSRRGPRRACLGTATTRRPRGRASRGRGTARSFVRRFSGGQSVNILRRRPRRAAHPRATMHRAVMSSASRGATASDVGRSSGWSTLTPGRTARSTRRARRRAGACRGPPQTRAGAAAAATGVPPSTRARSARA